MQLGPVARAQGVRLLAFDQIDSTNDEAKRLVASGERGPLWIAAARQTKGRGRLGRQWISPAGNLHASLLLSGFGGAASAPQLGFVAGVAAIAALDAVAGAADRFALKWPNDLLLDGGKLGGILLEAVSTPTGDPRAPNQTAAIVGVGVNLAARPGGLPYEARALADIGASVSPAQLLARLSDEFVAALGAWRGGEGFAKLRARWLERAAGLGKEIRVVMPHETLLGRFVTLDATGRLILKTQGGERAIDAGDVMLPEAGAAAEARA